ncbi:MAG: mechanosensitive ion channel domain-containing protein [Pseudomonadota bacterium]
MTRTALFFLQILILLLILGRGGVAFSQTPENAAPAAAADKQTILVPDIAAQAETAISRVRQLENRSRIDEVIDTAAEDIPALEREISYRVRELRQILANNSALETIRNRQKEWSDIELRATSITRDLTRAALRLDHDIQELEALAATWEATSKTAKEAGAPQVMLERVQDIRASIEKTKDKMLRDRSKLLGLQSRSAEMSARATASQESLAEASDRAVTRLFFRDSPPLWDAALWQASVNRFSDEAGANLLNQTTAAIEYLRAHKRSMALHALFFLGLCAIFFYVRSKISALCEADDNLRRSRAVYDMPLVSAMLIALLASPWFYSGPPHSVWIIVSVLGAAPMLVFARRVIDSSLYPVLYAVVGLYLADRLSAIFAPLPAVSRLIFLLDGLLLILFLGWVLRMSRRQALRPEWAVMRSGSWLALVLATIALIANIGGYARLAELMLRTVLGSAYAAIVLYALTRAGTGIIQGLLYVPPISMSGMVKRHRMLLTNRIDFWLKRIAFLAWVGLSLDISGLLRPLIDVMLAVWRASLSIGSLTLSIGQVLSAFLIVWAAILLSRLVRFVMEEEVYPNVRLDRGLPYAVSKILHYVLLLSGLVLALGLLGVDMTKLTIVAGALTVGIGFGLQNIVNNFVSGLIVLFERPIKVGDTIQIDDVIGRVQRIGIRASIVHSTTGAEVIIPNGKLIADKVTNWTLSNQLRQITVPVITKADVDVSELKKLLLDIAKENKLVVDNPPPEVLFVKRGIDAFEFELRVWTDALDSWLKVKSDLITEINEALRRNEMSGQAPMPGPGSVPDQNKL